MSVQPNPYDSSGVSAQPRATLNRPMSGVRCALGMIFIPIAVAVATGLFGGLLKKLFPQIDERYISLFIGVPWTVAAWGLAFMSWRSGHRTLALTGGVFWTVCGLFAAWITIGFWHG